MTPIWTAALIYTAAVVLLAKASILMYQTTKAPNFSIGVIMIMGAFSGYVFIQIFGPSSIFAIFPVAFLTGSIAGLLENLVLIEPLMKKGRNPVLISLSTIGVGLVFQGLLHIYNDWIDLHFSPARFFSYRVFLKEYDITVGGISGTLLISTISVLLTVLLFWYMYEYTRFGNIFRGLTESSELLQIQGYNPVRMRTIIWVLAGGLAGLAGSFMAMWFHTLISLGFGILTTVFAACFIGGIDNPKSAVVGGVIVGLSEIVLVTRWQALIGPWVGEWRLMVPLFFIVTVMALRPQGFLGNDNGELFTGKKTLTRSQFLVVFLVFFISYSSFDMACSISLSRTRDSLIAEFNDYEVIIAERDRNVTCFYCRDLSSFSQQLVQYNISTVYLEPFTDLDTNLTFYYERNAKFHRVGVMIERYGICEYRYSYK